MIPILIFAGLLILSYLIGCHSAARLIAKYFRSLNIDKVGTGHPDTENIFHNVGKFLGILTGIVDFGKIYLYLIVLNFFLNYFAITQSISSQNHLLVLGFIMVVGHCMPVTHHFKGGRGLFTYMGLVTFFAPWPMIIVIFLAMIAVFFFKQIRFAQYMIVLLPPFINFFFPGGKEFLGKMFIAAFLMGIINYFVSKKLGEI